MTRMLAGLLVGCALVVPTAACGSDDSVDSDGGATTAVDGEVISVSELLDRRGTSREEENVIVDAVLFEDESGMRICEALAESFPPQCGGRSIVVRNPDFVDAELTEEQGIRWSDGTVWLLGWIEDDQFVVS